MTRTQYEHFLSATKGRLGIDFRPLPDEWRPIKTEGNCVLGWQNGGAAIHVYAYTLVSQDVLAQITAGMDSSTGPQVESWSSLARSVSGYSGTAFSKYVVIPAPGDSTFSLSYMELNSGTRDLEQLSVRFPKLEAFDALVRSFRIMSVPIDSQGVRGLGLGLRQVQIWFERSQFAFRWAPPIADPEGRPHYVGVGGSAREEKGQNPGESPVLLTLEVITDPSHAEEVLALALTVADVPERATPSVFMDYFAPVDRLVELVATGQPSFRQQVFMAFVGVAVARERLSNDVWLTHEGLRYNVRKDPKSQMVRIFVTTEE